MPPIIRMVPALKLRRPVQQPRAPEVRGVLQAEERLGNIGEEMEGFMEDEWEEMIQEKINPRYPPFQLPPRKRGKKDTFLNMGEAEPWETEDIMEDDDDDISSLGHGELERHREMRHYARLVAWEMPLLSSRSIGFWVCYSNQPS
jgi:small subunit ribosomal protein S35